jgi:hypothetical protein
MSRVWYTVSAMLNGVSLYEWVGVLLVVLLIGVFCMRGFGSRKNY